ncbi:Canalicular multispecific organic anion transporter 1 [Coemansia nantahalensis]|uniref:Canalicular multispecific organic anion transporter 1 n=1 Tax=Coemansia nantahalensis TaxID=2789366 RepID=A0ACC1K6M4_9FUNG|nr:Canalicular multispecific organic anion transporter 1 [Coemansia nantahalensis]
MAATAMLHAALVATGVDRSAAWSAVRQIAFVVPCEIVHGCYRGAKLADVLPPLATRWQAATAGSEFTYDPTQRFFVVRAVARMAAGPMVPAILAEQLLAVAAHGDALLAGAALAAFDEPTAPAWRAVLCLAALVAADVLQVQSVRVGNWQRLEIQRIATAVELAVMRAPLRHSGLEGEHSYWLGDHYPRVVVGTVVSMFGHVSLLCSAALTVLMASHAAGGSAHMVAAAAAIAAVQIGVPLARLALDCATAWCFALQPYDIIDEICTGITSIKMFAWEERYLEWARDYHDDDGEHMYSWPVRAVRSAVSLVLTVALGSVRPLSALVAVRAFLRAAPPGSVDAQAVFQVQRQAQTLSAQIEQLASSAVNWHAFGDANRILEHSLRAPRMPTVDRSAAAADGAPAIALRGCAFAWGTGGAAEATVLRDISLAVQPGQLVVVTGNVAVGKSSLLLALCSELALVHGSGCVRGRVALVAQRAPLIAGTVRDNILFGAELDAPRLAAAIHACALDADLKRLPHGDGTPVGLRGEAVSGGQRMRVALARAVYADADIYLLDDPLAAVDATVARELTTRLLAGPCAALRAKTRVLATSSAALLPFADIVVAVDADGHATVTAQTPAEVAPSIAPDEPSAPDEPAAPDSAQKRVADDESPGSTYDALRHLLKMSGVSLAVAMTGLLAMDFVGSLKAQTWLQQSLRAARQSQTVAAHLRYYQLGLAVGAFRAAIREIESQSTAFVGHQLSEHRINGAFIGGLVRAPLAAVELQGHGAIAASYYSSSDALRAIIPRMLSLEATQLVGLASALAHTWHIAPVAVLAAPVAAVAALSFGAWSDSFARQLSDAAVATEAHATHTRKAIADNALPIRLHRRAPFFLRRLEHAADRRMQIQIAEVQTSDMEVALRRVISTSVASAVLGGMLAWQRLALGDPARLSSVEADSVFSACQVMFPLLTAIATAGKRLLPFMAVVHAHRRVTLLPREETQPHAPAPPASWPATGAIVFDDYALRYPGQKHRALDGVSLAIAGGEKIGVVGRTGAGKSSLAKALFRVVEGEAGRILIDGRDIAHIPLHELRARLAVIPQDPLLLHGSLRDNLDPLHQHTVEELWAAIIRAQLVELATRTEPADPVADPPTGLLAMLTRKQRESSHKSAWGSAWCWRRVRLGVPGLQRGLDKWIAFGGRSYSIGQRQLVGLCRALLRERSILVLDEATANVDAAADKAIHSVIAREFRNSTVLTIAHRLDTVLASDRIVVMDNGRVAQVGSPAALVADTNGLFARLLRDSQHECS